MRVCSYILIKVKPGSAKKGFRSTGEEVFKITTKIENIKMAHIVTELYDVITFIEVSDLDALSEILIQIRGVEHVSDTITCTALESYTNLSQTRVFET